MSKSKFITHALSHYLTLMYDLSARSSLVLRRPACRIHAALGDRSLAALEAGLRGLLAAPAAPSTLQLLELLADRPLGRRLLLTCLPQLMLMLRREIGRHSQTMR